MKTSPRPKQRPKQGVASSPRPKRNPMYDQMSPQSVEGRSVREMAKGGKCRGMGAASKGGKYKA